MKKRSYRRCRSLVAGVLAVAAAAVWPVPDGHAASRTWIGPVNGDWFTDGNWSDNTQPADGDTVIVTNRSILLTNTTPYLDTLTITNATITFTNWNTALRGTNIILFNNGKFQHAVCNTNADISNTNRIYLLCSNLTVNPGGGFDVTNRGYIGGRFGFTPSRGTGPGGGASVSQRGGGGGYGGTGGTVTAYSAAGGPTYGSAASPEMPGSGAGGGNAFGGNGGGAIWIEASGDVIIDGTLNASGGNGNGDQAGAGSGGGIHISCQTLRGSGSILANGGNRGGNSGTGGGGRIAVNYNPAAQAALVSQPAILYSCAGGTNGYLGVIGTIWFPDTTILTAVIPHRGELVLPGSSSWAPDNLILSNADIQLPTGFIVSVTNDLALMATSRLTLVRSASVNVGGHLLITNASSLYLYSPATNGATEHGCLVSVTGDLTVASGCNVYPYSDSTNGGSVKFVVRNLFLGTGGTINADTRGWSGMRLVRAYGPGGGYSSGSRGGGGGYGGGGGKANDNTAGGPTYGSATAPAMPGSGGGGGGAVGGNGGGLIWVSAGDQIDIRGTLTANGGNAGDQNGGGSGGGICLTAPRITGTGSVVRANGGGFGSNSGGGGGGRIAFAGWMTNQFDGIATATGGVSSSGSKGTNGTVVGVWDESYPFVLTVRGNPLRHEVSTPFDYGSYGMAGATPVTNVTPLIAEQTATARYYCYGWTLTNDAGSLLDSGGTTQAVFTVDTNLVLTWNWTNQWYLSTTNAAGGGLLQDMTGWYTNSVQVSVTATASAPYVFSSWSGTGVPVGEGGNNPITLTMNQARSIQANFVDTSPQTRRWTGTNSWLAAGNWNPSGIPGPNDICVIESGVCTLTDPASVVEVVVSNGATLFFTNWYAVLTATNVSVLSNGVITHAVCSTNAVLANTNRIAIVCSNLTVDPGGFIDANGRGYRGGYNTGKGQGPGGGTFLSLSGGGGGHGGTGSTSSHGGAGGPTYGSPYAPSLPGSGGAGVSSAYGGNGGGVISIEASGAVTLNGTVRASGLLSAGGKNGGGSGGSIWIGCHTLSGSGYLQANGGSGGDAESGVGGGGRIAVTYNQPAQALVVPQPTARHSLATGTTGTAGAQPGTLYLPSSTFLPDSLSDILMSSMDVYGVNAWSPTNLLISGVTVSFREPVFTLAVTNELWVGAAGGGLNLTNATVTCARLVATNGGTIAMTAGTNAADSLSIAGDLVADGGTCSYQFALTNPLSLTIGGNIVLTNGGKLYLRSGITNGVDPNYGAWLNFGGKNVTIPTNCTLFLYSHPTNGGSVKFTVNNLTVDAGGAVNGDGGGFAGRAAVYGYGPGSGQGDNNSAGGGGYGGVGGKGNHAAANGGPTYGSAEIPLAPGSPGGGLPNGYTGGAGGSLLWIEANRLALSGTLTANGAQRVAGNGGAGSGGGVYIVCSTLFGGSAATIRAKGADKIGEGGPGGGGRVAIWRVRDQGSLITINVSTGTFAYATPPPGTGTVHWVLLPNPGTFFVIH